MPGAGKSTIAEGLQKRGYSVFNMGDAIRAEAKRLRLKPTKNNLAKIMLELRERHGPGVVAQLIKQKVIDSSGTTIIDGVRSNHEVEVLRVCGKLKLLAVHASTETRFTLIHKRKRIDDPNTKEEFQERDRRELNVGISDPIALADESISNNNTDIDGLIRTAEHIIQGWEQ